MLVTPDCTNSIPASLRNVREDHNLLANSHNSVRASTKRQHGACLWPASPPTSDNPTRICGSMPLKGTPRTGPDCCSQPTGCTGIFRSARSPMSSPGSRRWTPRCSLRSVPTPRAGATRNRAGGAVVSVRRAEYIEGPGCWQPEREGCCSSTLSTTRQLKQLREAVCSTRPLRSLAAVVANAEFDVPAVRLC